MGVSFPNGLYCYRPHLRIQVKSLSEHGTGLVQNCNWLDDFMGDHEFVLDRAEMTAWARKFGCRPELLAHWFLGHAAATIAVREALPSSDGVVFGRDTIWRHFANSEVGEAHAVLERLLALETVLPFVLRQVGRDFDREPLERVRQRALVRMKSVGVTVEPYVPLRHARVIGDWGDKLYVTLHSQILPWLRNHIGVATGEPMQPA